MNEWSYHASGGTAYHVDDEGRIVDRIYNRVIGICTEKKNEILSDYDTLSTENQELKRRLGDIECALEIHKDILPDEIRVLIQKPPTVESLQNEISELKSLIINLTNGGRGTNGTINNGAMQKSGVKSSNPTGSGSEISVNGDKPE